MNYSVAFSKVAEQDLFEAASWYEDQRVGLGIELLEEVREKMQTLKEQPLLFQIRYEECRSCNLKRFPYKIIYSIEETVIQVWALYHHKREPSNWRREE